MRGYIPAAGKPGLCWSRCGRLGTKHRPDKSFFDRRRVIFIAIKRARAKPAFAKRSRAKCLGSCESETMVAAPGARRPHGRSAVPLLPDATKRASVIVLLDHAKGKCRSVYRQMAAAGEGQLARPALACPRWVPSVSPVQKVPLLGSGKADFGMSRPRAAWPKEIRERARSGMWA